MTPDELLDFVERERTQFIDLRFTDLPGRPRHITVPVREIALESFEQGFGIGPDRPAGVDRTDGDDLVLVPDADTAVLDPLCQHSTLAMVCDVHASAGDVPDSRRVSRRAEEYLRQSEIGDRACFAPTIEFYVLDQASYEQGIHGAHYRLDAREGSWRRGRNEPDNLGGQPEPGRAAFVLPPTDSLHNLRAEMTALMQQCGLFVEGHHHGPGTAGHCRIRLRFAGLREIADKVVLAKYLIRNAAARHGKVATFMPKPLFGECGSGLHVFFSLLREERALFPVRDEPPGDLARWAIGGLLRHAGALCAFTNPTTNSYKRLVPGFGAPLLATYARSESAAMVRVPTGQAHSSTDPNTKRVEVCSPDASCNPYLAFSALLMAALDGIENRSEPGPALQSGSNAIDAGGIPRLPRSLDAALEALSQDHVFLLKGDVFTEEIINTWIEHKREREVEALRDRPHPYEFCLYFDV